MLGGLSSTSGAITRPFAVRASMCRNQEDAVRLGEEEPGNYPMSKSSKCLEIYLQTIGPIEV